MKLRNDACLDTTMILTNLTLLRRYFFQNIHKIVKKRDMKNALKYHIYKYHMTFRLRAKNLLDPLIWNVLFLINIR